MKRLAALTLVLALMLALTACGHEADPNVGLYEAQTVEFGGFQFDVEALYKGGLSLSLKENSQAVMILEGTNYSLKWKMEGETLSITAADMELTGTLSNGTMTLDMGEIGTVTFTKIN